MMLHSPVLDLQCMKGTRHFSPTIRGYHPADRLNITVNVRATERKKNNKLGKRQTLESKKFSPVHISHFCTYVAI